MNINNIYEYIYYINLIHHNFNYLLIKSDNFIFITSFLRNYITIVL